MKESMVYIVEHNHKQCQTLNNYITSLGYTTIETIDFHLIRQTFNPQLSNVLIINIDLLHHNDGLELYSTLVNSNFNIPVIFISSPDSDSMVSFFISILKKVQTNIELRHIVSPVSLSQLNSNIKELMVIDKQTVLAWNIQTDLHNSLKDLTEKERCVLFEYMTGIEHKRIAKRLNVSFRTVQNHLANIKRKVNMPVQQFVSLFNSYKQNFVYHRGL